MYHSIARHSLVISAPCTFSFVLLLTQHSGIVGTKCVHDTMGHEFDAKHPSFLTGHDLQLASLFWSGILSAASCAVVSCIVACNGDSVACCQSLRCLLLSLSSRLVRANLVGCLLWHMGCHKNSIRTRVRDYILLVQVRMYMACIHMTQLALCKK